jgi:hypothetical protein
MLAAVVLAARAPARGEQQSSARPVAITSITIVDMSATSAGTAIKTDQTILIRDGRIEAVGGTAAPADAQRIDGRGKYVIPGLWDMHAHALQGSHWTFPLLVANGVIGIRDPGSRLPVERIRQLRRESEDGRHAGPRVGAATARVLNGPGGRGEYPFVDVETPEEGRRLVKEYKQQGVDFIKPYNLLSRDVYLAIVDEAKQQRIPFAGHVPVWMSAAEVSDLGQASIEHLTDILVSCSRDEDALRRERQQRAKTLPAGPWPQVEAKAAATYDEQKASALFARFVRNGTWMTPTLAVFAAAPTSEPELTADARLKYVPAPTREWWHAMVVQRAGRPPGRDSIQYTRRMEIVGAMNRAGVRLLAGTDIVNPALFPGFSLHEELELLVQAGLSPLQALQTATLNPARFLDRERELGTIERGKLADLLIVDANPLDDIRNTRKIAAVILGGRVYDRAALDAMLADAADAAAAGKTR